MPQGKLAFPSASLIDVVVEHQGIVSREQLLRHFPPALLETWIKKQVLVPEGEGRYALAHLTAYVDGLVLAQWAIPEGIIGKLSALVFHELSVALPKVIDVSLPPGWKGTLPADLGIRPFVVSQALRDYGVMTVYPTPPGTVPVHMYSPAVALAQVWADPALSEETKLDGLMMYRAFQDEEQPLQEAFDRYGLSVPGVLHIA